MFAFNNKSEKAFSLIELMVVIAIIAILSALVVPAYKQYLIKSKVLGSFTVAKGYADQMLQVYNAHGGFPGYASQLNLGTGVLVSNPTNTSPEFLIVGDLGQIGVMFNNDLLYAAGHVDVFFRGEDLGLDPSQHVSYELNMIPNSDGVVEISCNTSNDTASQLYTPPICKGNFNCFDCLANWY